MNPSLQALGAGVVGGWIGFWVFAEIGRRSPDPQQRCAHLRIALLLSAVLPLVALLPILAPRRVASVPPHAVELPLPTIHWVITVPDGTSWFIAPLPALGFVWLLLVGWGTVTELRAWAAVKRLRQQASPATAVVQTLADEIARDLAIRAPEVRLCPRLDWAGAAGSISPVVFVPDGYSSLPSAELRLVLRHELIHLRRRDPSWARFERFALALLGWHPARSWFKSELCLAREAAVDREVAEHDVARYATLLVDLAQRATLKDDFAWVPMAGIALERRIEMLFDPVLKSRSRPTALVSGFLVAGVLTLWGSAVFADGNFETPLPGPKQLEPKVETDVEDCYAIARQNDPKLVIDTFAELEADRTGQVVKASVPTPNAPRFQSCIEPRALKWRFPPPKGAPTPPADAKLFVRFPIRRADTQ